MNIDDFSHEVLHNLDHSEPYQLDPITMAILVTIISTVISHLLKRCLNNLDSESIRKPGLFARLSLKRQLKTEFRNRAPDLADTYCMPVYNSILQLSQRKSDDQIMTAIRSCSG